MRGSCLSPVLKTLAELGAFGIKIPRRFGGLELTQYEYQKVATLCGSFDASLTVLLSAAQSIGVPEPLRLFGTEEQKAKYLPRLARGEISGFALTEETGGLRHRQSGNVRRPRHRKWQDCRRIASPETNSSLRIPPSRTASSCASLLIVIARIVDRPEELHDPHAQKRYGAFIVETRWPGCSVTRLRFEGVRGIYNGAPTLQQRLRPQ